MELFRYRTGGLDYLNHACQSLPHGAIELHAMQGHPFHVFDDANFETEVLGRAGLTVVDFWAEWCVPCRQLSRLLEEIAHEVPAGVRIGKVDADKNPALVERYGVRSIPALLFFKDGKLIETRTGVDRRQVIKKAIEKNA